MCASRLRFVLYYLVRLDISTLHISVHAAPSVGRKLLTCWKVERKKQVHSLYTRHCQHALVFFYLVGTIESVSRTLATEEKVPLAPFMLDSCSWDPSYLWNAGLHY